MNTHATKRIGRMADGQPQLFDEWQLVTKDDPAVVGDIITWDDGKSFDLVSYDPRRDCMALTSITARIEAMVECEAERIYRQAERLVIGRRYDFESLDGNHQETAVTSDPGREAERLAREWRVDADEVYAVAV